MTSVLERPAAQAPIGPTRGQRLDRSWRIVFLAILVAAVASMWPWHAARSVSVTTFLHDVKAGHASGITYVETDNSVRWKDTWWRWRKADLDGALPSAGRRPTVQATVGDGTDAVANRSVSWLDTVTGAGVSDVELRSDGSPASWPEPAVWRPLGLTAGCVLIASFFWMIGRDRRRYANRWAWFWMFVVAGALPATALFLIAEPGLIWRSDAYREVPKQPRVLGGYGFCVAIFLRLLLQGFS